MWCGSVRETVVQGVGAALERLCGIGEVGWRRSWCGMGEHIDRGAAPALALAPAPALAPIHCMLCAPG